LNTAIGSYNADCRMVCNSLSTFFSMVTINMIKNNIRMIRYPKLAVFVK